MVLLVKRNCIVGGSTVGGSVVDETALSVMKLRLSMQRISENNK